MRGQALTLGLLLAMLPIHQGRPSNAIDQQIDTLFSSLSNRTDPGLAMTPRRGVLAGGSLSVRNRIYEANPLSVTPPSFKAGCGGIDLYGGSFSFINGEQFITLLRSIAANAGGYAFQLGINAMCPDCGTVMTDLQKKVQQLNQMFANSCQLAQGVVNDGLSAMNAQQQARLSTASVSQGLTDVFGGWSGQGAQGDPLAQAMNGGSSTLQKSVQGNLIWRALQSQRAESGFLSGSPELLEWAMSVTGTLVVSEPSASADAQGMSLPVNIYPPLIDLEDFLTGSQHRDEAPEITRYHCDSTASDACLHPQKTREPFKGIRQKWLEPLIGPRGDTGLLRHFSTNQGSLTPEESDFLNRLPRGVAALFRNLARDDPRLARLFAEEAAEVLALEACENLFNALLIAVEDSAALTDHAYGPLLKTQLDRVRTRLQASTARLQGRQGRLSDLVTLYEDLMATQKNRRYGAIQRAQSPPSP